LYVFDDSRFRVTGTLTGNNVTLWFAGSGKLEIEGSIAISATDAAAAPVRDELPGFALVFASGDKQTFELGAGFQIGGSVYAYDATWKTDAGDCPAETPAACSVQPGVIAVTKTDFGGGEPTVDGDLPVQPSQPPHLVQ
jgi:hypothetical protein